MMIPIEQAKALLESLVERSAAGEDVVITRDGRPVAKMVSITKSNGNGHPTGSGRLGAMKDLVVRVAADFDEPLDDFEGHMQ